MIVLDASVIIKLLVREPGSDEAFARIADEAERIAPDFCTLEVAAALTKKVRLAGLDPAQAQTAFDALPVFVTERCDSALLIRRTFRLASVLEHALYDCLYLALAIDRRCPLLTADLRFIGAVRRAGLGEHVESLPAP